MIDTSDYRVRPSEPRKDVEADLRAAGLIPGPRNPRYPNSIVLRDCPENTFQFNGHPTSLGRLVFYRNSTKERPAGTCEVQFEVGTLLHGNNDHLPSFEEVNRLLIEHQRSLADRCPFLDLDTLTYRRVDVFYQMRIVGSDHCIKLYDRYVAAKRLRCDSSCDDGNSNFGIQTGNRNFRVYDKSLESASPDMPDKVIRFELSLSEAQVRRSAIFHSSVGRRLGLAVNPYNIVDALKTAFPATIIRLPSRCPEALFSRCQADLMTLLADDRSHLLATFGESHKTNPRYHFGLFDETVQHLAEDGGTIIAMPDANALRQQFDARDVVADPDSRYFLETVEVPAATGPIPELLLPVRPEITRWTRGYDVDIRDI